MPTIQRHQKAAKFDRDFPGEFAMARQSLLTLPQKSLDLLLAAIQEYGDRRRSEEHRHLERVGGGR